MESKIEWHYLPELPDEQICRFEHVIVCYKDNCVDVDTVSYNKFGFWHLDWFDYEGNRRQVKGVYAWAYLPKPAEVK